MKEVKSKKEEGRRGQIGVVSVKASRPLWMVAFAFAAIRRGGMRHRPPAICDVAMYAYARGEGKGGEGRDVAYLNSRSGRVISQNVNIFAGAEQAD